eukprot:CAMPEP_0117440392 /NCGR_PEP_ID=MMETSP0759-20121206/3068_1 /TAXON_ID=63605 /ORGANISM="Percolomonas cosmopolitus, Strain WS" /LENGTH=442 /DNA_ID=CAMNT_0005232159 /DNA_START=218 /DNA_END=1544 /DNA_ORIENTATION=-
MVTSGEEKKRRIHASSLKTQCSFSTASPRNSFYQEKFDTHNTPAGVTLKHAIVDETDLDSFPLLPDQINVPSSSPIFSTFCNKMDNLLIQTPKPLSHQHQTIALGLSGGSDSLALFCLLYSYCKLRNHTLWVCIVDHSLREKDSWNEAVTLHQWLHKLHVNHSVYQLHWTQSDLQRHAKRKQVECRERRKDIFLKESLRRNVNLFCTGHHLNDQIETFLYRWAHQSHLKGLAGWDAEISGQLVNSDLDHFATITSMLSNSSLMLGKPLLTFTKAQLRHELIHTFQCPTWFEDPTNFNHRKDTRAFLRKLWNERIEQENEHSEVAITEQNFLPLFEALQKVDAAIEHECIMFMHRNGVQHDAHALFVPQEIWADVQQEFDPYVQMRILVHIISTVSQEHYHLYESPLNRHMHRMLEMKTCTIGHVMFQFDPVRDGWLISKENR